MNGTICSMKKATSNCMFILGEDGIEYLSHKFYLAEGKRMWKYCYIGNTVTFDVEPSEDGPRDRAVNVVVARVPDPQASIRRARAKEMKENRAKKLASASERAKITKRQENNRKWNEYKREHHYKGAILIVKGSHPDGV